MALIDDGGAIAGGANWGCYGPSLVPVLPQAPGGAQQPPSTPYATALALFRQALFCSRHVADVFLAMLTADADFRCRLRQFIGAPPMVGFFHVTSKWRKKKCVKVVFNFD